MPNVTERPVVILGAGATKACGGPLTAEILPAALNGAMADEFNSNPVADREQLLPLTRDFLVDCFNVPANAHPVQENQCPALPFLLSMVRRSSDMGQPIGAWTGQRLIEARRAIEYAVFAVIEAALKKIPAGQDFHSQLLEPLYRRAIEPSVVSLNYDVIVDNTMFMLSERFADMHPPDYRAKIATQRYVEFCRPGTWGKLLKIHGSLNWLYCEKCKRLDLFISPGSMRTGKALDELYHSVPFDDAYSCRGTPCRNPGCGGYVSPIMITPTYVRDYENPHIKKAWDEAEAAMKASDRAVIIGYSLPQEDVEVSLLLKRGLDHLPRNRITVVEYAKGDLQKSKDDRIQLGDHPTGQRFRTLFGKDIDWHTTGFEGWLREQNSANGFPFSAN